jgi:Flp pilus assembly protein TadG
MSGRRSLAADRTGLAAIEFAVLVPVFLSFILLLIAGAGLAWAQEVLQETAQSTARCMAAEPTTCATTSAIQTYATTRAANDGLTLTSATITPLSNQTCNGVTGMNQVTISMPYQPLSGTLFSGMITLNAVACYPTIA